MQKKREYGCSLKAMSSNFEVASASPVYCNRAKGCQLTDNMTSVDKCSNIDKQVNQKVVYNSKYRPRDIIKITAKADKCTKVDMQFNQRFVHNSKCRPRDIESQMVHPLYYLFALYRRAPNTGNRRSYATVVKQSSVNNGLKGPAQCMVVACNTQVSQVRNEGLGKTLPPNHVLSGAEDKIDNNHQLVQNSTLVDNMAA